MTLTENFIRETIHIDGNAEVMFGSDEMYDTYPCYIPTVEFMLVATDALAEVADRIRMEKGFLPTHPRDGAPIPDLIDKKECDKIERKRRVRNERTKT